MSWILTATDAAAGATSGLAVLQQIEIVEGASALVFLVVVLWLLGAGRLVIGRHFEAMQQDRDFWRSLYLDRLRNGPRGSHEPSQPSH